MRDRGVSEVLSFVLVFSLIALTVGVVYVGGMGNLEGARNAEELRNAERAFDVLDDNVDDIVQGEAPNRGTEIKLSGAQLTFGNVTELNVTTNKTAADQPYVANLRPIVYQSGGPTDIVYEAGATVRSDRGGAIMLEDPPVSFGEDLTLLQFVQTKKHEESPDSVGGENTVLVRTTADGRAVLGARPADSTPYEVTFNVTTDRPLVWADSLEERIQAKGVGARGDPCQVHGNTVECVFETERLYVSVTRINVELS